MRRPSLSGRADGADGAAGSAARRLQLCWGGAALAVWMFTRQYHGVVGDSRIYLGRALADLSPATVGRDLMFLHDGQSVFSLFPFLERVMVGALGAPIATAAIAFAATCLWAAAFTGLAVKIAPRGVAWAMLIFVAILPSTYGGLSIFPFGQAAAIPRPFAEAAVLAAMWAALDRRRALAWALLVLAAVFHPIMAVCGIGVLVLMLGMDDARWWVGAGVVGGIGLVAALVHLPVADRLFRPVDPAWLDLLHRRSPYLFPALWPAETWGRMAVQLATAILTALLLTGRARALVACSIVVGVAGVAATSFGGDLFPSLLVLQVQPWRALWLVGVLAAGGAALCVTTLWRQGPGGHVILVLLALSWLLIDQPIAALPAALALGLYVWRRWRGEAPIKPLYAKMAWMLLAVFGAVQIVSDVSALPLVLKRISPEAPLLVTVLQVLDLPMLVLLPLVAWLLVSTRKPMTGGLSTCALTASAGAVLLSLLLWNAAPASTVPRGPDAGLLDLIKARPGEVAWIDGDTQAWLLADRPSWASEVQGASIVFSREAALAWRTRIGRLLSLHLVGAHTLSPWATMDPAILRPSATALTALCATPGGPAWIISPVVEGESAPALPDVRLWTSPYRVYLRTAPGPSTIAYAPVSIYAVIACAPRRLAGGAGLRRSNH